MTQEEIVHVPAVVNNYRHHHVEQNVIVDFHVPEGFSGPPVVIILSKKSMAPAQG